MTDEIKDRCPFKDDIDLCICCGRLGICYTTEQINELEKKEERGEDMKLIKRLLAWFTRPKCPNGYRCGMGCIHAYQHWEGIHFRGFSCDIDAR